MRLNASQTSVVECQDDERILVMAGAGTGKTATSVHWVAELIRGGKASRGNVLMITFTRKAASEMANRIEGLIESIPKRNAQDSLTVGTYHAVAGILMRQDAVGFGLSHNEFTTIDESEGQSIWKSALKQSGLTTKSSLFVPDRINALYSLARNTCVPMEETFQPIFRGNTKKIVRVVAVYEELKRAANVVDYDDLLVLWHKRMKEQPAYAEQLRNRWTYVLVDEMQDNNRLNESLLEALKPRHLLVVGDANQSIYGFRGSEVKIITDFPSKHKGTKVLKLENNYRSGQNILDLANAVVAGTPSALKLQSSSTDPGKVDYRVYLNSTQEASGVVKWIQARVAAGHKPSECAILSRSSKALTAVEIALNTQRIFYKKYGGLTLADAAEIKDFISFLRISHNLRDKIALLRALVQFPGIGEGTAAKAIASHQDGLFDEMHWPQQASELPKWIDELRAIPELGKKGRYLQEKVKDLMLANYPKDGEERLATINALVVSMEGIQVPLPEFLDGFVLNRHTNDAHPNNAVILSTIHSSKGLEWDGVWLVGAGSTQMPHPRTLDTGETEEERRLFYVAVTRAKRHLVISYPGLTDRKQNQSPTPFAPDGTPWEYASSG